MKYNPMNRRMFLQGSGGAMVAIPFLSSLLPRTAWSQAAPTAKRFVSISADLDYGHNSVWLPNGTTNITNIPQPVNVMSPGGGQPDVHWQKLRDFAPTNTTPLARVFGTTLSPYLESVNILRSLDYVDSRGHDSSRLLGGARLWSQNEQMGQSFKAIPTIDQVLNSNKMFNPAGLPLIYIGQDAGINGNAWSYAKSGTGVSPVIGIDSLRSLYNSLFRSGAFPESGAGVPAVPANPRREILGRVLDDFKRVMNSRNISSVDRGALSDAMDKLSDVQKGLAQAMGGSAQCSYKGLNISDTIELYDLGFKAPNGKAVVDLITASMMCDSARVFNLGLGSAYWEGLYSPAAEIHDGLSHQPFAMYGGKVGWQILSDIMSNFYKNVTGPLLQNLSAATDPSNGKSLLFNSIVLSSIAAGQTHGVGSQPVIMAGNAGGTMTSGNYIDYADRSKGAFAGCDFMNGTPGDAHFSNNWRGLSYNRLLVSILQAMGLTPADYEDNSLNAQLYNRSDLGALNVNLTNIGGYGYAASADINNRSGDAIDLVKDNLKYQDLKQFRNKLPML